MSKNKLNTRVRALYEGLRRHLSSEAMQLVAAPGELPPQLSFFLTESEGPYADLLVACDVRDRLHEAAESATDALMPARKLLAEVALAVHVDDMQYATRLARTIAAAGELTSGDEAYAQGALNERFEDYLHDTSVYASVDAEQISS